MGLRVLGFIVLTSLLWGKIAELMDKQNILLTRHPDAWEATE
jgi:hypothetical protein